MLTYFLVLNGFYMEVVYQKGEIIMHTKIKRAVAIILSFVMIVCFATTASAVQPRYSYTNATTIRLSFTGTTANCSIHIYGFSTVTSITDVNVTLKDSNGTPVGIWRNLSSTGQDFSFFDTVPNLNKGEHYNLSFSAKVNTDNGSEIISGSTSNDCPE